MKRTKIIAILIVLLIFISLFALNISAEEKSQFIVYVGPIPTYYEIDGEYTWKEYIDKYEPEGFAYNLDGVYLNTYPLLCLGMSTVSERYIKPDDLIQTEFSYDRSSCNHEYTYVMSGRVPCQYKTIVYQCKNCGYSYREFFEPSIDHEYVIELDTYIPGTCASPGYARYECVYCGDGFSEEVLDLNPDNHITSKATCEKGRICTECGMEFSDPLGHDLDVWGNCMRSDCEYSYNLITDVTNKTNSFINGFKNNVDNTVDNTKETVENFLTGIKESIEGTLNSVKSNIVKVVSIVIIVFILYYIFKAITPYLLKLMDKKANKNK